MAKKITTNESGAAGPMPGEEGQSPAPGPAPEKAEQPAAAAETPETGEGSQAVEAAPETKPETAPAEPAAQPEVQAAAETAPEAPETAAENKPAGDKQKAAKAGAGIPPHADRVLRAYPNYPRLYIDAGGGTFTADTPPALRGGAELYDNPHFKS